MGHQPPGDATAISLHVLCLPSHSSPVADQTSSGLSPSLPDSVTAVTATAHDRLSDPYVKGDRLPSASPPACCSVPESGNLFTRCENCKRPPRTHFVNLLYKHLLNTLLLWHDHCSTRQTTSTTSNSTHPPSANSMAEITYDLSSSDQDSC